MTAELVARIDSLKKRVETLEARERPIMRRGWGDDFFGQALHEQYAAVSNGLGSSGALQNNAHGGVYRLTAGAGAGFSHYLWLGDAADGYATLDADLGWVMIARMTVSATTNIIGDLGAMDSLGNNYIRIGLNTLILAANWYLSVQLGGAGAVVVDSDVPADTNPHVHRLEAYPIIGGRQVDYFLDGVRVATTTSAEIPTAVITPYVRCYTPVATSRYVDLGAWDVIPN